jgi:hypothetical protein
MFFRDAATAEKIFSVLSVLSLASFLSVPLAAQTRAAASSASAEQLQARREISALEGVLENAVKYGAQMLTQHIQSSTTPQSMLLTGLARARGFRLDGYGVLFDVEFPSIRRSVAWSMRALERPDPDLLAAMKELRKNTEAVADPRSKQELDRMIKALDDQIKAYDAQMKTVSTANASRAAASPPPVDDPRAIYAGELTNALVDAILDHGAPVGVAADEWLTVAARESLDMRFTPDNPNDTATTLILRIKGSDLNAFREHRLSRDEARKKIEVKQY